MSFLSVFSHFIAPVATTHDENGEVISAASIAVEAPHHWKGEILHYDRKCLEKHSAILLLDCVSKFSKTVVWTARHGWLQGNFKFILYTLPVYTHLKSK